MDFGVMLFFQNLHQPALSDSEMVSGELELGLLAEELDFDFLFIPEHHFSAYSMSADNTQLLTWLAAKTERITLGTAGVILPWHQPYRVAERLLQLDILSNGRVRPGFGRGGSPAEFAQLGVDQSESGARFSESVDQVLAALRTGQIQGDGPLYPQQPASIRPFIPGNTLADRGFIVSATPNSGLLAADLGLALCINIFFSLEQEMQRIEAYRERFRLRHDAEPPPILLIDQGYFDPDHATAARVMREHFQRGNDAFLKHYGDAVPSVGDNAQVETFLDVQLWGTPEDALRKIQTRMDALGEGYQQAFIPCFGGLPYADARASVELFAREIVPAARELKPAVGATRMSVASSAATS